MNDNTLNISDIIILYTINIVPIHNCVMLSSIWCGLLQIMECYIGIIIQKLALLPVSVLSIIMHTLINVFVIILKST